MVAEITLNGKRVSLRDIFLQKYPDLTTKSKEYARLTTRLYRNPEIRTKFTQQLLDQWLEECLIKRKAVADCKRFEYRQLKQATLGEIHRKYGNLIVSIDLFKSRMLVSKKNWSIDDALNTPPTKYQQRKKVSIESDLTGAARRGIDYQAMAKITSYCPCDICKRRNYCLHECHVFKQYTSAQLESTRKQLLESNMELLV